jgi:D-amino-acid oxidase
VSDQEGAVARADVVVVGCGVIGLTSAIVLREAGLDARIVTAEFPEATTSSVAAAIWYPYKAYPEDRVLSWGREAYGVF